jgi:hypothetical protein
MVEIDEIERVEWKEINTILVVVQFNFNLNKTNSVNY